MPAWLLKTGATTLTLLAAVFAAHHVSEHLKNASAPLHPAVVQVAPGVRSADVQPLTTSYVS